MRLRIGMIGTGWMGEHLAEDVARDAGLEIAAVAGRDRGRTEAFATRFDIARALDAGELLRRDDVDLVYVATTHESHLELALAAIAAGRAVLVEKPLTTDAAGADLLFAAARHAGVFAMEAMWMRFNPVVRRALSLVADGAIGEPRALTATFGFALPVGNHRLWDPARAGGSLLDQGVYPLTLADEIWGDPATVAATATHRRPDGTEAGVDTEIALLLGYDGGPHALLASSIRSHLALRASLGGSGGVLELEPPFWGTRALVLHRPDAAPIREEIEPDGHGYLPMLRAVAEAIAAGATEHAWCPPAATRRVLAVADRVRAVIST